MFWGMTTMRYTVAVLLPFAHDRDDMTWQTPDCASLWITFGAASQSLFTLFALKDVMGI